MSKPILSLVSVVMPSLNQAAFLEAAIESVLSQSYRNVELIVADGGSIDGSLDILGAWQAEDSRLRIISGSDNGPAQAVNKALCHARGTFIGWLNSDDIYADGSVQRAVSALSSESQHLMVYGHGQHIDAAGRPIDTYPTLPPLTPIDAFFDGCFICQPTVFFRRTLFLMLGKLDERLKTAFDFDYWLRAFKAFPGRIGFVDTTQAYSRLHEDCITLRLRRTVTLEGMEVLSRHFGSAPRHWITSYIHELASRCDDPSTPKEEIQMLLMEARPFLKPRDYESLAVLIDGDLRLTRPPGAP